MFNFDFLKGKKSEKIIENLKLENPVSESLASKDDLGASERTAAMAEIFEEEEKEYNLSRLHDQSDSLISSLGYSILLFGVLVVMDRFFIPNPLFLATAVFALYFSLTSMMKPSFYKTIAMSLTFPLTAFLVLKLMDYHVDINTINNGLSLIALSISLIIIPRQKIKQRSRSKVNKLKNDIIKDLSDVVDRQNNVIDSMQTSLDEYKTLSAEIKSIKAELEIKKEHTKSS